MNHPIYSSDFWEQNNRCGRSAFHIWLCPKGYRRYYLKDPHWWTIDDVEEQNLKVVVKDNEVQSYNFRKGSTEKITKE